MQFDWLKKEAQRKLTARLFPHDPLARQGTAMVGGAVCEDTGPVRQRLGSEMVKRRWNGITLFNFMDKDASRIVSEPEFVHAILSMGICAMTEAELRKLWNEARASARRTAAIPPAPPVPPAPAVTSSCSHAVQRAHQAARALCSAHAMAAQTLTKGCSRAQFDSDGSGELDMSELRMQFDQLKKDAQLAKNSAISPRRRPRRSPHCLSPRARGSSSPRRGRPVSV
jgi:hypothetical protein